ncbi:MAG: COX15/CtaA family protein [Crocinitomicaceae bacterium]|jgi:cytochrome c oxidase assembly protein subunit 15|tara:strand:- start:1597 stop:2616 length:1020 start_codon:yes stop_codon:yes gene_type:complete
MVFSRSFIRFNWLVLVLIYLVVIAGSFVRITGSGMGCPDWPKCFGEWIPPTSADDLPGDYRQAYLEKRSKKVVKFTKVLSVIGMGETASLLRTDPSVYEEEPFNAQKTWIEYVNRLFGFLAGNAMLFVFFWLLFSYRKSKLLWICGFNLILMGFQAWFGSIVVATNLVPWTITVHLFLALLIIAIQIYVIILAAGDNRLFQRYELSKPMLLMLWGIFAITFYQMFLGTQVRESIDVLIKNDVGQDAWTEGVGLPFYIHRSFSWLVLVMLLVVFWINEKQKSFTGIRVAFIVLALELLSGVLLAHFNMPDLVRTAHLLFASILFGVLFWFLLQGRILQKR